MSFHAAGCNVGDTCSISLPPWVHEIGDQNPDIFFTDRHGYRNRECLSLGCDDEPVLAGRTPLRAYETFVRAFCDRFAHLIGAQPVLALLWVILWRDVPTTPAPAVSVSAGTCAQLVCFSQAHK